MDYIRNEHEEFNHQYLGGSGIPAAGIGRQPVRIKRIANPVFRQAFLLDLNPARRPGGVRNSNPAGCLADLRS